MCDLASEETSFSLSKVQRFSYNPIESIPLAQIEVDTF